MPHFCRLRIIHLFWAFRILVTSNLKTKGQFLASLRTCYIYEGVGVVIDHPLRAPLHDPYRAFGAWEKKHQEGTTDDCILKVHIVDFQIRARQPRTFWLGTLRSLYFTLKEMVIMFYWKLGLQWTEHVWTNIPLKTVHCTYDVSTRESRPHGGVLKE